MLEHVGSRELVNTLAEMTYAGQRIECVESVFPRDRRPNSIVDPDCASLNPRRPPLFFSTPLDGPNIYRLTFCAEMSAEISLFQNLPIPEVPSLEFESNLVPREFRQPTINQSK